jgi:hypothetical protein
MEAPLDQPLHDAKAIQKLQNELGTPVELFAAGRENLIAGVVIAILCGAAGVGMVYWMAMTIVKAGGDMPFYDAKNASWSILSLGVFASLLMMLMGVGFILYVRMLASLRIYVCREGFFTACPADAGGFLVRVFRWDQIAWVEEHLKQQHFPLKGVAKYAVPMGKYRSYTVRRYDGLEFFFDGDTVRKVGKLASLVQRMTSERGIPWRVVE